MGEREVKVQLSFGALAPTLEEQLTPQGLTLGNMAVRHEKECKALTQLMFGDVITDSEHDRILQRLFKRVMKSIKEIESDE